MNRDINGDELILDVDGDTSITADTDDQIDIKIGGADDFAFKANKFEVQTGSNVDMNGTELILDADGDTSITADTDDQIDFKTGGSDRLTINSSGNVGIGTTSPSFPLHVSGKIYGSGVVASAGNSFELSDNDVAVKRATNDMTLSAGGAERARIDSSGHLFVGKTSASIDTAGCYFDPNGTSHFSAAGADVLYLNRKTNDGTIVGFYQDGTLEGYIVVSGSTVSYSGFTGTHWSRLEDNSKPTILRGTIMESLDEMCDWYQAVADVAEVKDSEGNVTTPAHQVKESINLGSKSVGDSITFTSNGVEYTGKIEKEGDIKHSKAKVSDTEASKLVYGLFVTWDENDTSYNDMLIAQTGTYVIRIHKDETVSKGDLIQSKGDGTGKAQADDIMRASTVAKVLSTTKIETYSDGSYIVPCSLHC
jgi:predicted DNA-binding protein